MTHTTLKEDLEGLIVGLDREWADAKEMLKAGKSLVARSKSRLTNARTKKAEAERALSLLYPPPPEPRVWSNIHEIPSGTAVSTPKSQRTLNVLPDGTGWWSHPGNPADRSSDGWPLRVNENQGPFTEILKESK